MPTRPGTPEWVTRSRMSDRPALTPHMRRAMTPGRSESGALITDPTPGLDQVYDNAFTMKTIAASAAPRGSNPYAQRQAYSSSFKSRVPNTAGPQPMSREKQLTPVLGTDGGPAYYSPFGSQSFSGNSSLSSLSGSIYWASRGRLGPIGIPNDPMRRSASFSSAVPRLSYTAQAPPLRRGINRRDEASQSFVLKSDDRNATRLRNDFHTNLQQQLIRAPMSRPLTAPGL